jgi:hypothetical protein
MDAFSYDRFAIIADEIAEHNKLKPSSCISPGVQKARFEELVQLVKTVLERLEAAEMGKIEARVPPKEGLKEWFAFVASPRAARRLLIEIDTDHLNFSWEEPRFGRSAKMRGSPDLYWNPSHRRWVGEELGRDLSRAGAPRVRESPEAVVTRAILNALDAAAPENP